VASQREDGADEKPLRLTQGGRKLKIAVRVKSGDKKEGGAGSEGQSKGIARATDWMKP